MATIEDKETRDEVLAEVRAIKDSLAAAVNYDIRKILDQARENQKQAERPVPAPPKP
jgi:hypothetical protein